MLSGQNFRCYRYFRNSQRPVFQFSKLPLSTSGVTYPAHLSKLNLFPPCCPHKPAISYTNIQVSMFLRRVSAFHRFPAPLRICAHWNVRHVSSQGNPFSDLVSPDLAPLILSHSSRSPSNPCLPFLFSFHSLLFSSSHYLVSPFSYLSLSIMSLCIPSHSLPL
jgi:hypothetical protein